jgi:hypothetical protein
LISVHCINQTNTWSIFLSKGLAITLVGNPPPADKNQDRRPSHLYGFPGELFMYSQPLWKGQVKLDSGSIVYFLMIKLHERIND